MHTAEEWERSARFRQNRIEDAALFRASDDQLAAYAALSIDSGEWTWDSLDQFLAEPDNSELSPNSSQFRSRVVELFNILMEHDKGEHAPEFVAAVSGPPAEQVAAARARWRARCSRKKLMRLGSC